MKTEKKMTLELLMDTINMIEAQRLRKELSALEKVELDKIAVQLRATERNIIRSKTDQMVAVLTKDATLLNTLAEDLKASSERLGKVAETVGKVSKIVDVLAKIAVKTVSVGLL